MSFTRTTALNSGMERAWLGRMEGEGDILLWGLLGLVQSRATEDGRRRHPATLHPFLVCSADGGIHRTSLLLGWKESAITTCLARSLAFAGASDQELRLAWARSEFRRAWAAGKAPPER